jgi:N-acyl-D-aspartate/D-glutamate deacylase
VIAPGAADRSKLLRVSSAPPAITEAAARRAHRVLRAVWMIVSSHHDDALAAEVARMGERLRQSIDDGDLPGAAAAVAEVRAWMATMAGVVTSRMTHAFDEPE